jgi:hypothetical protein
MNPSVFLCACGLELTLFGLLKFLLEFLNLLSQVAFLIPRKFKGKHSCWLYLTSMGRCYMTLVHWYQLVPVRLELVPVWLGFWLLPILAPILLPCGLSLLACTCYLLLVILITIWPSELVPLFPQCVDDYILISGWFETISLLCCVLGWSSVWLGCFPILLTVAWSCCEFQWYCLESFAIMLGMGSLLKYLLDGCCIPQSLGPFCSMSLVMSI